MSCLAPCALRPTRGRWGVYCKEYRICDCPSSSSSSLSSTSSSSLSPCLWQRYRNGIATVWDLVPLSNADWWKTCECLMHCDLVRDNSIVHLDDGCIASQANYFLFQSCFILMVELLLCLLSDDLLTVNASLDKAFHLLLCTKVTLLAEWSFIHTNHLFYSYLLQFSQDFPLVRMLKNNFVFKKKGFDSSSAK